jgi:hypothetical protein
LLRQQHTIDLDCIALRRLIIEGDAGEAVQAICQGVMLAYSFLPSGIPSILLSD